MMTTSFSSTSISGALVSSMYSCFFDLFQFDDFYQTILTFEFFYNDLDLYHFFSVFKSLTFYVLDLFDFLGFFLLSVFLYLTLVCSSSSP